MNKRIHSKKSPTFARFKNKTSLDNNLWTNSVMLLASVSAKTC